MNAAAEIRQYAERIARLETGRRELASDIKDVKAEAKSAGLNVKLIAACVRLMLLEQDKQDAAIREHSELDLYLSAIGLLDDGEEEPDATPAGAVVAVRSGVTSAAGEEAATVSREGADETRQDAGGTGESLMATAYAHPGPAEASVVGESPAPASAQVSRESASEVRGPGSAEPVHRGPGIVPPLPEASESETPAVRQNPVGHDGTGETDFVAEEAECGVTSPGGKQPGTLPDTPHRTASHDRRAA